MTSIQRFLLAFGFSLAAAAASAASVNLPDFSGLVEEVGPAVVNIEASQTPSSARRSDLPDEEEIPEIFRRFFGPGFPMPPGGGGGTSLGSGFIISADGYVLTNHHVVDGADEVVVHLSDRRELKAKLVGSDAQSDIALLKIQASGLPALKMGDSKTLKPGQWVIAIGSPFGFDHSVTAGVVSGLGRPSLDRSQQYVPFIQTDVAINRGNSGGPLLNTRGEVVGINSQIFSNSGGYMGVSFAIPVEVAMNAVQQLKTTGRVTRGQLGVTIQNVDRDQARALGLKVPGGALVNQVTGDSAAEKGGIEVGDVIVAFNGQEVASQASLPPMVGAVAPGSRAAVTVMRDGKRVDLPVTLSALTDGTAAAPARATGASPAGAGSALGIAVEDLDPEQRRQLQLKAGEGVVVARVTGEAARRAGLRPGDIVTLVGRNPVGTAAAFEKAVKAAGKDATVMLLVKRGGQSQFVAVTPRKVG